MDGIGFFCEKPSKFDENHILPSKNSSKYIQIRRNSTEFIAKATNYSGQYKYKRSGGSPLRFYL